MNTLHKISDENCIYCNWGEATRFQVTTGAFLEFNPCCGLSICLNSSWPVAFVGHHEETCDVFFGTSRPHGICELENVMLYYDNWIKFYFTLFLSENAQKFNF